MADLGVRSIQANVKNATPSVLFVQSVQLTNPETTHWISGAQPKPGEQVGPSEQPTWGAATDKSDVTVGGTVSLAGLGSPPIVIIMKHDGKASVTVVENDMIKAVVEPGGGDPGHGIYNVTLSKRP